MLNVLVAVVAALPFGWGLGLIAARLIGGADFGQLPAFTIPVFLLAAIAYAVLPLGSSEKRRNVLLAGAAAMIVLGFALS